VPRALVDTADAALYTAKAEGRDRVTVAGVRSATESAG
jgi:PleD family two-component response regulator